MLWATQQAEKALQGRMGPKGGNPSPPFLKPVRPARTANTIVRNLSEGVEDVAPVEGSIGPAVAGGMSTGFKVLKVGGRVMIVVSILMVPVETALAPEGQRVRTFVVGSAGLAGGYVVGTLAASLVCGPGAPVCALVIGLGAGIVGTILGQDAADAVFDAFDELKDPTKFIHDATWSSLGTPEARSSWCDEAAAEGTYDPDCEMACLIGPNKESYCDMYRQ